MSLSIVSSGNQLQVVENGVTTFTLKAAVSRVDAYLSKYLRIFVKQGYRETQWAKIDYAEVSSPSSSDLDALVTLVNGYLDKSVTFTATSGQTTFDCTGYFYVNDNYRVTVNGQRQTYSVSRSGDVITVANAVESDEVIIDQP